MALELVQRLSVSSEKAKATEIETSVGKENPSEEEKAQVAPQASNQEELSDEAAERPDQTEGEQKSDGEMSVSLSDIASLTEEFPNVRIEEILGDKAFLEFAKHSKGNSLADCYSGYLSFLKTLPAKLRRSDGKASSTAFGAQGNAFGADYSQSLKKQQMDIAKSAGMSYREYCELMSSIPHGLRAAKSTNV